MKRIRTILLLLLTIPFLTSCWSKHELNELVFVTGIFIDNGKDPNTVEVTISTPLPNRVMTVNSPGSSEGSSYSLLSKTGNNIPEALQNIQKDLSRKLLLSETKIIVLGREYAEDGINELLEWIQRNANIRISSSILVAPHTAKEVSQLTPIYEQFPTDVLSAFVTKEYLVNTNIKECLLANANHSAFVTPYLSYGEVPSVEEDSKKIPWSGIGGSALFTDNKLTRIVNVKESRAIAWAKKKVTAPLYTVNIEGQGHATVIFNKTSNEKSFKITENGPEFTITLNGSASLIYLNVKDKEVKSLHRDIIRAVEKEIHTDLKEGLRKSQEVKADILHLGSLIVWNDPENWKKLQKNWSDVYAETTINIKTNFNIIDTGKET